MEAKQPKPVEYGFMSLSLGSEPIPLERVQGGSIRVRGTRVTLDTVVHAFQRGSTAEEIVYQFPALGLADVYAVIGYYLNHQTDVEGYLAEQEAERDEVRREAENRHSPDGIRERLLARKKS